MTRRTGGGLLPRLTPGSLQRVSRHRTPLRFLTACVGLASFDGGAACERVRLKIVTGEFVIVLHRIQKVGFQFLCTQGGT